MKLTGEEFFLPLKIEGERDLERGLMSQNCQVNLGGDFRWGQQLPTSSFYGSKRFSGQFYFEHAAEKKKIGSKKRPTKKLVRSKIERK